MTPKVFMSVYRTAKVTCMSPTNRSPSTGVTGYIGGDALYGLNHAHPDWEYSALIRTQDKADKVKTQYPKIRIVIGDLDSFDTIKDEASKADIVLRKTPNK